MLPSEMLPLSHNSVDGNGNVIRQGIEFDRLGRRVAFHFLRRHPGDSTDPGLSGETVRVPASEVLRASTHPTAVFLQARLAWADIDRFDRPR